MTTPDLPTCSTSAATAGKVRLPPPRPPSGVQVRIALRHFHEVISWLLAGEVTPADAATLLGAPVLMEVFPGKKPPVPTTNTFADALAQGSVLSSSVACSVVDALRDLGVDLGQHVQVVENDTSHDLTLLHLAVREGSSDLVAHLLAAGAGVAPHLGGQPPDSDELNELVEFARARAVDADAALRARIDGVVDVMVAWRARVRAHSLLSDVDAAHHDGGVGLLPSGR